MHVCIELVLVVLAWEVENNHGAVGPDLVRALAIAFVEDVLEIWVVKEVIFYRRCHLLQAQKVRITLLDNLQNCV